MFDKVFLAEKPKLGRAIAEFLPGKHVSHEGWIECGPCAVTWAFGHLLEQCPPEKYGAAFRTWARATLPIVPDHFQVEPRPDKGISAQIDVIKKLATQTKAMVNAGDPDREGQLLVDEILEHIGYSGQTLRVLISAFDRRTVEKALAALCSNSDSKFRGMCDAAKARSELDWLAGMNLTRAMTLFGRGAGATGVLSLGRVQTPTLALVVQRDLAIENFKPTTYFELSCLFKAEKGPFNTVFEVPKATDFPGRDKEGRLTDRTVCDGIADAVSHKEGIVTLAESKRQEELPPLPYSLSDLQKEASSKYGMGVKEVLDICQDLYESGFTTYPRTDCSFLPEDQFADSKDVLQAIAFVPELAPMAENADPTRKSRAWNSSKVTAHHAIIPTTTPPKGLSGRKAQIYALIASRFAWQFHKPRIVSVSKIVVAVKIETGRETSWRATGKVEIDPGWTAYRSGGAKKEVLLPDVKKGDSVKAGKVKVAEKKTTPPDRFTEGTLVDAMKNIQNFVGGEACKEQKDNLKRAHGIGTEATRAGIIQTLFERDYIVRKGKGLISTDTGRQLISLCPATIRDPLATADMEAVLSDIEDGRVAFKDYIKSYADKLPSLIEEIFSREATFQVDPKLACPQCGKALRRIKSKKGKWFWSCCGYPDCTYAAVDEKGKPGRPFGEKKAAILSDVDCPVCGKHKLVQRSGSRGVFWSCPGYPKCRFTCPDADGQPDMATVEAAKALPKNNGSFKCPECNGLLRPRIVEDRISGGKKVLWICANDKKHRSGKARFFEDREGKPILPPTAGAAPDAAERTSRAPRSRNAAQAGVAKKTVRSRKVAPTKVSGPAQEQGLYDPFAVNEDSWDLNKPGSAVRDQTSSGRGDAGTVRSRGQDSARSFGKASSGRKETFVNQPGPGQEEDLYDPFANEGDGWDMSQPMPAGQAHAASGATRGSSTARRAPAGKMATGTKSVLRKPSGQVREEDMDDPFA